MPHTSACNSLKSIKAGQMVVWVMFVATGMYEGYDSVETVFALSLDNRHLPCSLPDTSLILSSSFPFFNLLSSLQAAGDPQAVCVSDSLQKPEELK